MRAESGDRVPEVEEARERPLVTVVTVVRNAALTIPRTLASLRAQNERRARFVIVDGNSSDSTWGIITEQAPTGADCWQRVDSGYYDSVNFAVDRVRTPFFVTVNGDDELLPPALSQFCEYVSSEDGAWAASLGYCGHMLFGYHDGPLRLMEPPSPDVVGMYLRCPILTPAFFFNTHTVRTLGGFASDLRIAADLELAFRALLRGYSFGVLPFAVSRMTPGGVSAGSIELLRETFVASRRAGRRLLPSALHVTRLGLAIGRAKAMRSAKQ